MSTFVPTEQNRAIFAHLTDQPQTNLFVQSGAGTGKTTQIIHSTILPCMTNRSVAVMAFSKPISVEFVAKLKEIGSPADAGTVHSFGYRALREAYPRVKVDKDAKWEYLLQPEVVPPCYHAFVKKACGIAKQRALGVIGQIHDRTLWYAIIDHFGLDEDLDEQADIEEAIDLAIQALEESNRIGRSPISPRDPRVLIDFDDMVYLPCLYGLRLRQYDEGMMDEAQDTNDARRILFRKMIRGRMTFVGDRYQCIFGFTGADADSVDRIIAEFGCASLPLSWTWRCPKAIVRWVYQFVPEDVIQAHPDAPEGEVVENGTIEPKNLRPHDAILCRNTRPLVEMAYTLLRAGVACHVEGKDIGSGLMALCNRWKVRDIETFLDRLEAWETRQVEKLTAKGDELKAESIRDRAETIRVLSEGCDTVQCVRDKITAMFYDTGEGANGNGKEKPVNVTLCTAHKSKGREWERVYLLGYRELMPSRRARQAWEIEQERNLIYVAGTRVKWVAGDPESGKLILVG